MAQTPSVPSQAGVGALSRAPLEAGGVGVRKVASNPRPTPNAAAMRTPGGASRHTYSANMAIRPAHKCVSPSPRGRPLAKAALPCTPGTTLQMFDFDNTYTLLPGTLCSQDMDCGCAEAYPSACVNHRCTYAGMEQKMGTMTSEWIRNFVLNMMPVEVSALESSTQLIASVRQEVQCEEVYQYLQVNAAWAIEGRPYPCRAGTVMEAKAVLAAREKPSKKKGKNRAKDKDKE